MKQGTGYLIIVFFVSAFFCQTVFANSNTPAVKTMAGIMVHLNHYPSGSEKDLLGKLLKDGSTTHHEHILAQAMINLNHQASSADKKKLQEVVGDKAAPQPVRDLANIVMHLSHSPSGADKAKLQELMK